MFHTLVSFALGAACLPSVLAQLNPINAPNATWSPNGLTVYEQIVSTLRIDAVATDLKNWDLLSNVFLENATASYGAGSNLTVGLDAIKTLHAEGTEGFISHHVLSNFLVTLDDDEVSANVTYYGSVVLFANPQQNAGQFVNLYNYFNNQLVKTPAGWRVQYLEMRYMGPGWTGNVSILPPDHPVPLPSSYELPNSTISSR